MAVYAWLGEDDERRDAFLQAELRLYNAYLLIKSLPVAREHADAVLFCQRVRKQRTKTKPGTKVKKGLENAVQDLIDDHLESDGVIDIFKLAGIDNPDISILDDEFLQTPSDHAPVDLNVGLTRQDEEHVRGRVALLDEQIPGADSDDLARIDERLGQLIVVPYRWLTEERRLQSPQAVVVYESFAHCRHAKCLYQEQE